MTFKALPHFLALPVKWAVLLTYCFAVVVITYSQPSLAKDDYATVSSDVGAEWILDIPYSPVKFEVAERQENLIFGNRSGKEITGIRIGIVKRQNNRLRVLSHKATVKIIGAIPSGQGQTAKIIDYRKDIHRARVKKAKLAVVAVRFSDGSDWRLTSEQPRTLPNTRTDESSQQSESWINLLSAPLIIQESPNGRVMMLTNTSTYDISRYALGCVVQDQTGVRVVARQPAAATSLSAYDSFTKISEGQFFELPAKLLHICERKTSKITVIEVQFKNGTKWIAEQP